jgi:hypothetical protein
MGWLTKFFRGSTHNISEEQYHSRPAEDTAWNEPSSSPVVTVRICHALLLTFYVFEQCCVLEFLVHPYTLVQDKRMQFCLSSLGKGDAVGVSSKKTCPVLVIEKNESSDVYNGYNFSTQVT